MKLISGKKKNILGMLIAEAKFRAVNILETEDARRFVDTIQLIDKLNDIAYEIGGEKFELTEISAREHAIRKEYERQIETKEREEKCMEGHIVDSKKAYFCPLRPLPPKKEKEYVTEYGDSYRDGWNDCIETIKNGRDN